MSIRKTGVQIWQINFPAVNYPDTIKIIELVFGSYTEVTRNAETRVKLSCIAHKMKVFLRNANRTE